MCQGTVCRVLDTINGSTSIATSRTIAEYLNYLLEYIEGLCHIHCIHSGKDGETGLKIPPTAVVIGKCAATTFDNAGSTERVYTTRTIFCPSHIVLWLEMASSLAPVTLGFTPPLNQSKQMG